MMFCLVNEFIEKLETLMSRKQAYWVTIGAINHDFKCLLILIVLGYYNEFEKIMEVKNGVEQLGKNSLEE